jgi:hypothetical protein
MVKKINWNRIGLIIATILGAIAIAFILNLGAEGSSGIGIASGLAIAAGIIIVPIVFRNPEKGLALVGFFLPFERVPSINLGGATLKINHVLIIIVLFAVLARAAVDKKLTIPKDGITVAIFIFMLTNILKTATKKRPFVFLLLIVFFSLFLQTYQFSNSLLGIASWRQADTGNSE